MLAGDVDDPLILVQLDLSANLKRVPVTLANICCKGRLWKFNQ